MQDVRKATVALIVQSCATVLLNEELVVEPLFRADERTFQRISWDRTVQFLSNKEFRVMYRMDLEAFNALLFKLRQRITSNPKYLRKAVFPVIPELRLALTLRYLAGGSVQDLWLMYGVSRREVYRSIWMTIDAINDILKVGIDYTDIDSLKRMEEGFAAKSTRQLVRGCIGAIDEIQVKIRCPSKKLDGVSNPREYFSRKGFYSVNVQATCDADRRFTDFDIRWPGSDK